MNRGPGPLPGRSAPPEPLAPRLAEAALRRAAVAETTTAYRLVDDAADGFPGVIVDRYAEWAVLSVLSPGAEAQAREVAEALLAVGLRGVHVKRRPRADLRRQGAAALAPEEPIAGEAAPADLTVSEHALRIGVSLADGLSTGLFTDQRDNRQRVTHLSRGAGVLNLFAYTCTFTVAAALGGARETISVDLSPRALDRGRANLERNGVSGPAHRLLRADAVAFVARALRREERFDLIVLDPPSFGTRGRRTFSVEQDYAALATSALTLLAPGGRLLAVTNHRKTSLAVLIATLRRGAASAGRSIHKLEALPMPLDHPHRPGGEPPTKSVLVTLGSE